jgi:hypothetical protein
MTWALAALFLAGTFLIGVAVGRTGRDGAPTTDLTDVAPHTSRDQGAAAAPSRDAILAPSPYTATDAAPPDVSTDPTRAVTTTAPDDDAVLLALGDVFVQPVGPRGLEFTARVRALAGRRVRVRGFVVRQDRATPGRLLIAPRPILLHEEEYGLADDLPAATVLVLDPSMATASAPDAAAQRPVEVVGTLAIGSREEPDGRVSLLRLTVDDGAPPARAARQTHDTRNGGA